MFEKGDKQFYKGGGIMKSFIDLTEDLVRRFAESDEDKEFIRSLCDMIYVNGKLYVYENLNKSTINLNIPRESDGRFMAQ